MIALDFLPLRTVEKQGFRRLMAILAPGYQIKSRYTFSRDILNNCYNDYRLKVKETLQNVQQFSFTTDAWSTESGKHSLLSVTANYLSENSSPRNPKELFLLLD